MNKRWVDARYDALVGLFVAVYGVLERTRLARSRLLDWPYLLAYDGARRVVGDSLSQFLRRYPQVRTGHVLDLGANVGYASRRLARAVSPTSRVVALEPDETNLRRLRLSLRLRAAYDRVTVLAAAAGEEDGEVSFWQNLSNPSDHRVLTQAWAESLGCTETVSRVASRSVDSVVAEFGLSPNVSLVKVDVQGYELPVLRGMRSTVLENPNLVILLEYAPEVLTDLGFDPLDVLRALEKLQLHVAILGSDGLALEIGCLEHELRRAGYVDLLVSRFPLGEEGE